MFLRLHIIALIVLFVAPPVRAQSVLVNGKEFFVEIADTQEKRRKGLMFRETLCAECGMLFIFEHPHRYGFWMKNVRIPLDILYIDKDGTVVDLVNAQPCETEDCDIYYPAKKALYVLEVNHGNFTQNIIGVKAEITYESKGHGTERRARISK